MSAELKQVRILLNSNVKMSRGKAAAQAVHAALNAYGIDHDRVVVLHGSKHEVMACDTIIADAGRTEVAAGTVTAGCNLLPAEVWTGGAGKYSTDPDSGKGLGNPSKVYVDVAEGESISDAIERAMRGMA